MPRFYDNGPDSSEWLLLCTEQDAFTLCCPILQLQITADKKTVDLQDGGMRDTTAEAYYTKSSFMISVACSNQYGNISFYIISAYIAFILCNCQFCCGSSYCLTSALKRAQSCVSVWMKPHSGLFQTPTFSRKSVLSEHIFTHQFPQCRSAACHFK